MWCGSSRLCPNPGGWIAVGVVVGALLVGREARGEDLTMTRDLEHAEALIRDREFDRAAVVLRDVLAADPENRRAKEMLAFALESRGDLDGELRVRSALATEFPDDAHVQTDYGRVLERRGEQRQALDVYRRARALGGGRPDPELDTAIERVMGRTSVELGAPLSVLADPDATSSRAQVGAAVPFGSRHHLAVVGAHQTAEGRTVTGATTSDELALSAVLGFRSGASITVGPRFQVISPEGADRKDTGVGGAIAGHVPLGRWFEADLTGEIETPWNESAITVLRGGRTTAAEGRLYAHLFSRRVLLQAGARRRQLTILPADPASTERPEAWQSLRLAGLDVVVWRKPGATVRGEMLDDMLTSPAGRSSSVSLGYRYYGVTTETTPEFHAQIGLAPRGSVHEASAAAAVVSPRGRVGAELRAGFGWDVERRAEMWRAGGTLTWAPRPRFRLALGYERAEEFVTGLTGRRRAAWLSLHVDL